MSELPDQATYRARWSALHGGYEPAPGGIAERWLTLVEALARPLAARGIPAMAVTAAGLASGLAAAPLARGAGRWPLAAAGALGLSALADGVDGSVAVLSATASDWGFVVDSLADRACDLAGLLALRELGAPLNLVAAAAVAVGGLEYGRARAAAAGFDEIGVVTVGERPMRLAVTVAGLAIAGAFPAARGASGRAGAGGLFALATGGAVQFLCVARAGLRGRHSA